MNKIHPKHLNDQNRGLGYFGCFKDIFVKLQVLRVFQSFCMFRRNVTNFLGFRGVSLIFKFWVYFGNFLGFGGLLVIFQVLGIFQSFFRFLRYFSHFLGLWGILVIFQFYEGFWSFFRFRVYFYRLIGLRGIFVILQVSEYFGYFLGFGNILVIF